MSVLASSVRELTDEEVRSAALEWVNVMREEYDLPALSDLPPGTPGSAGECVLANALSAISDGSRCCLDSRRYGAATFGFAREGEWVERSTSCVANEFAIRFDRGRYPELITAKGFVIGRQPKGFGGAGWHA